MTASAIFVVILCYCCFKLGEGWTMYKVQLRVEQAKRNLSKEIIEAIRADSEKNLERRREWFEKMGRN